MELAVEAKPSCLRAASYASDLLPEQSPSLHLLQTSGRIVVARGARPDCLDGDLIGTRLGLLTAFLG